MPNRPKYFTKSSYFIMLKLKILVYSYVFTAAHIPYFHWWALSAILCWQTFDFIKACVNYKVNKLKFFQCFNFFETTWYVFRRENFDCFYILYWILQMFYIWLYGFFENICILSHFIVVIAFAISEKWTHFPVNMQV